MCSLMIGCKEETVCLSNMLRNRWAWMDHMFLGLALNKFSWRSLSMTLCGMSDSFSTRHKNLNSRLTKLAVNNRRLDGRTLDSPATPNQGVISQLSEQISALNERMDEFTSRIEELNSKFSTREVLGSQQNLGLQVETCYGSVPSSLYMDGLSNGPMTGSLLPNS